MKCVFSIKKVQISALRIASNLYSLSTKFFKGIFKILVTTLLQPLTVSRAGSLNHLVLPLPVLPIKHGSLNQNEFIITWILHQVIMYFNKVKPLAAPLYPSRSPPHLLKERTYGKNNVHISNLNCQRTSPCQYIHVFYIHF